MPTYEYVCDACEHRFERFQKISDEPVKTCPECGKPKARRLISPGAGLLFKGSGFYATDYRKGPPRSGDGGEGEGGTKEKGGKKEQGRGPGGAKDSAEKDGS